MRSRRRETGKLESALRGFRSEASSEFVDALSERVRAERLQPRRQWSRLVFAAAISVFVLGTFASFGGLSYAASGATQTYDSVKKVVVTHKVNVSVRRSSAGDQYKPPPAPHKVKPATVTTRKPPVSAAGIAPASTGTLPFTGLSLLGTLLMSLSLIGGGIALRRRERRNE